MDAELKNSLSHYYFLTNEQAENYVKKVETKAFKVKSAVVGDIKETNKGYQVLFFLMVTPKEKHVLAEDIKKRNKYNIAC